MLRFQRGEEKPAPQCLRGYFEGGTGDDALDTALDEDYSGEVVLHAMKQNSQAFVFTSDYVLQVVRHTSWRWSSPRNASPPNATSSARP